MIWLSYKLDYEAEHAGLTYVSITTVSILLQI
jgi:hypothetical protein